MEEESPHNHASTLTYSGDDSHGKQDALCELPNVCWGLVGVCTLLCRRL